MDYKLYKGDCLEVMTEMPDKSIDMILCDLPYNTTSCKWDIAIPFNELWEQYERIIKDNGAIVLFGKQPFTSKLVCSNLKMFRYELIWDKVCASNPMLAKKQPLQKHENICVFYKKQPTYNPQMTEGVQWNRGGNTKTKSIHTGNPISVGKRQSDKSKLKYPKSIITYSTANRTKRLLHPTQKNLELCEWLIRTYTNEGEIILDNCMGSGTTGVAALNTNRKFIGIELDEKYFNIAKDRLENIK